MNLENAIRMAIQKGKGRLWKTQKELSAKSGVSQPQISRFLRGEGTLGMDAGCAIIESLGGSVVFPGDIPQGCVSPEAATIDNTITHLRKQGRPASEIADMAVAQLRNMLEKIAAQEDGEERKIAS